MDESARREIVEGLIDQTTQELQSARQQGILLEAALKDAEQRYASLQGRLSALKEIRVLHDTGDSG